MRRRPTGLASAAAALAVLLGGCGVPGGAVGADDVATAAAVLLPAPDDAVSGTVERVVDGDTVVVVLDGVRERVRLLRIDTPELARDGRPAECLAGEASAALASLLPPGSTVQVATDVESRDRFGRLLAHLWADGIWVNGQMLRDGYASVLTVPPNTSYDERVLATQRQAREDGVGLWSTARCP